MRRSIDRLKTSNIGKMIRQPAPGENPAVKRMVPSTISIAGAGAPAHGQIADERPHPEGDADGLIRIVTYGFVGSFRAFDRFVADTARDFLGAFQRGGETSAGFRDFFAGDVGGGGHQGARVFGERAHVIAGCLCMLAHICGVLSLFVFFSGNLLHRRDELLPACWPQSEPSFFRQTGWTRFLWPAGRASIGHPPQGSIHTCRAPKPFPSASDRPLRDAASWLPAASG